MNALSRLVLSRASFFGVLLAGLPAGAASLQKVDQSTWGLASLPSYVNMYIYVPDKLATKPPIVAAPHHCGGNGPGTFNEMSSLVQIANNAGFVMIFPEATGENCWDAGSTRSLKHDGGGDTQAIVQMVKYALSKYGGDPNRVYSVGSSSGGIMTEALLGVYPDVFMAGVSLMGVPCGCWGQNYNDVTGNGNSAQWSGPCAGGTVTKTGQQWGELVRSYFPGYSGHRPRLQHWHGTADMTLSYKNLAEDVKEWTNLLALPDAPTGMDTPKSGTTHQFWKNSCGYVVYETFSLAGVGHSVPFDGNAVAAYFGIDKSGGQDPETAACPGAVPGGSGTSGAGGMGSSGGASGSGGTSSSGGANASGGTTGGAGHVGVAGSGGSSAGSGGALVGVAGTSTGTAGSGAVGPSGAGGVMSANGGTSGVTASSGAGASNVMGAIGGSAGSDGIAAAAGGAAPGDSNSGCNCAVGSDRRDSGVAVSALLLAALGWLRRRPKRRLR